MLNLFKNVDFLHILHLCIVLVVLGLTEIVYNELHCLKISVNLEFCRYQRTVQCDGQMRD